MLKSKLQPIKCFASGVAIKKATASRVNTYKSSRFAIWTMLTYYKRLKDLVNADVKSVSLSGAQLNKFTKSYPYLAL